MSDLEAKVVDGADSIPVAGDDDDLNDINYKPPAEKKLDDILSQDKDDEALERYKAALLGDAASAGSGIVVFPDDKRIVIVQKLTLLVDGRPDLELDLTQDLAEVKKKKFVIKEGVKFKIRIDFIVQREIVTGLKYNQKTSRMGVTVDKNTLMVGSYAPKATHHSYTTPPEDAPSGMTGRGSYHVYSLFTDDDKNEHLKWEWNIEIKKDWEEK